MAICTLEEYVGALATTGTPFDCTLMMTGKVIGSTKAAAGTSAALAGGVSEESSLTAEG